jgi:SAM-dependent methyltransferase
MDVNLGCQNPLEWRKEKLTEIPCLICDSLNYTPLYTRLDNLTIVQCQHCQFRFIQPQPSQTELNHFYQEGYFSGNRDFYRETNYFQSRKEAIKVEKITGWAFLKKHADLFQKRVLDLGCADGALLVLARQYGATQVTGIEISSDTIAYGRKEYGLDIIESSADTLPFASEFFDIVTAFDLIEHVRQPKQLFQEVNRVLCTGGLFIGCCPDMGCYDDWGGEWIGVQKNMEHLSYFDDQSLLKLATQSGFEFTHLEYQGFPLQLARYNFTGPLNKIPLINKALQVNIWLYNLWQKMRVKKAQSNHRHELLFVFKKLKP